MGKLNNIKVFWDRDYRGKYSEENMFEGQLIQDDDGWFEGIVHNHLNNSYAEDRLIFGAYFMNVAIELLTFASFRGNCFYVLKGNGNVRNGYDGSIVFLRPFEETPYLGCRAFVTKSKKKDTQELQFRIDNWKKKMYTDEKIKDSHENKFRMRREFLEALRKKYEGRNLTEEEIAILEKVTGPVKIDGNARKLVRNIAPNR